MSTPLLSEAERIDWAAIRPEHVSAALDTVLADAEAALDRAGSADVAADLDVLELVLDVPVERLQRVWGAVCHLQAVADSPALRAAHAANLPRVADFHTRLGSDERLFARYQAIAASPAAAALPPARRTALANALRDFRLGGAELQGEARARFAAIQARAAELSQRFADNVLDATDAFALFVDPTALDGVPADVVSAAREAAAAEGRAGCKLTLKWPCYWPVLQFASDRTLREQMFRAYSVRASELGEPAHDNSALIDELVALRAEAAALLGMPSYAHLSLVPKMARSPDQVLDFVRDLARRSRPHAERELAELREFAREKLGLATLEAWDRPFAAEKLRQQRYAFGSEEVRGYFTEPRVLAGLFDLVQRLFGVEVRPDEAPVWHPSVRFYRLWRDGEPVAAFYLDAYARPGKQQGAWMDGARQRWARPDGGLQRPVTHLVCNFAPPVDGRPALLSHDDLITLFHEFGHGLHHMLTQVDELSVSGLSGVEWDACELPSQFMENFCWEWEVLRKLSSHVDSGEALPRELFDRMKAARNFHNGLTMLRHCEYGLFDMRLHLEPPAARRSIELTQELAAELSPVAPPPFVRYPHSFTHLFSGAYAAGYYSYAWAEVLSSDAYAAFEEAGIFDATTGERFRRHVLEVGGSRPALENFVAFRGREPRIDALLRHRGLA
ncbi:MAG: M3 family metallopeptidase [Rubrivivax sp.]